jgi:Raf kinase inhibitor-like YbhB/YbcL family protein
MARSIGRRRLLQWLVAGLGGVLLLTACDQTNRLDDNQIKAPQTFKLTSPAFEAEAFIPAEFTCDGADRSPALSWEAPPEATQSLALILEDPDAPGKPFVHWAIYDLPPDLRQLPAAIPNQPFLTQGGVQGKNDFGQYGYRGPCPPKGTHRYFFKLYAVDKVLDLPPGVTQAEVQTALKDHILATAELMGRYSR